MNCGIHDNIIQQRNTADRYATADFIVPLFQPVIINSDNAPTLNSIGERNNLIQSFFSTDNHNNNPFPSRYNHHQIFQTAAHILAT